MKSKSIQTMVAIGIGAALFFVLGRFVAIPSPMPNTNICVQYGLLAFMAITFGPVAGALIGFIGHALIDLSFGWGIWWSWVISSACFGFIVGIFKPLIKIKLGQFGKKEIIRFNIIQIASHAVAWVVIAPLLDIIMYKEPVSKVFLQGITGGTANAVTTLIVGTLICIGYAATRTKKDSLDKEK